MNTESQYIHIPRSMWSCMQYFDVSKDLNWCQGIRSPKFSGVPYTYFPQRQGCRVSLYQDAHVPDNFVPRIPLAGGRTYQPHRYWEDVFDAIIDRDIQDAYINAIRRAKNFIYIENEYFLGSCYAWRVLMALSPKTLVHCTWYRGSFLLRLFVRLKQKKLSLTIFFFFYNLLRWYM